MMAITPTFLIIVVLGMIGAICMVSFRVIRGPTAPDRVVALDVASITFAAIMVIFGIYYREAIMLDAALLIAFLSFIGTLFIAKYIEGRGLGD
ncbi:MAG: monovalent cation/H+ antiporter complex subunit F [Candidatus Bathyarchaeota archaeon]